MLAMLKAVVNGPEEKVTPYVCDACRSEFELRPFDPRLVHCPECGRGPVKIKVSL